MKPEFRIASRQEGQFVNFYFAGPTMEGSLLLLSVHYSVVNVKGWEYFKDAVVETLKVGMKEVGIETSDWRVEAAPEHERAGQG